MQCISLCLIIALLSSLDFVTLLSVSVVSHHSVAALKSLMVSTIDSRQCQQQQGAGPARRIRQTLGFTWLGIVFRQHDVMIMFDRGLLCHQITNVDYDITTAFTFLYDNIRFLILLIRFFFGLHLHLPLL